jgi:plastocyanin domain-containing protein
MDPVALWIAAGGAVLAFAVDRYFFAPPRPPAASPAAAEGPQEVHVTVRGGYEPPVIEVRAGRPVRLLFRREEVEGCSDTVLMPAWGIAQRLEAFEDTPVEFTPQSPGEYEFTCGMGMLRGKVVVR